MTATTAEPASRQRGAFSWLIHRQLDSYPNTGPRVLYLAITVLATITLYYEAYVNGSVSVLIMGNLHMSFTFYVATGAVGNAIGAFTSLFAGLSDRYGRANLTVFGLLVAGVFVTFLLPASTSRWEFTIFAFIVGAVEGVVLVSTPALIRDLSPQTGRATAMGFWTSGPVLGSLVVAIVGSITVPAVIHNPRLWTHEYYISGTVGLVVFVIALIALRELSPGLRDQLMVSIRDRTLVELRAKGLDIEAAMKNHWRQLLKADVVISGVAVSVMLLIYYALVGLLTIFAVTIFGYTIKESNNLGYYCWAFNAGAVILIGWTSDRFRVRKPFMIIGAVGSAVMVVLFLLQSKTGAHPSFALIATYLAIMLFFLGVAYTPWMASFTETVEHRNPAAVAAGLAIWGWIIRIIVFGSTLVILVVITSVTPLVNASVDQDQYPALAFAGAHPAGIAGVEKYSTQLAWAAAHPTVVATAEKFAPELTAFAKNPTAFEQAAAYSNPAQIPGPLLAELLAAAGGNVSTLTTLNANKAAIVAVLPYATQLTALKAVPASVDAFAKANATELAALKKVPTSVTSYISKNVPTAEKNAPGEFKTWYWVCVGGLIFFLLSVPLLRGRWSPRAAKKDEDEHEALVQAELAKLQGAASTS
jgi:MFS family permease